MGDEAPDRGAPIPGEYRTFATIGPRAVGTPTRTNEPSEPVDVLKANAVTVAPMTGLPLASTTLPTTIVSGSGRIATTTFVAAPMFPPRSMASAPIVMLDAPTGAVDVNSYGCEVSMKTTAP